MAVDRTQTMQKGRTGPKTKTRRRNNQHMGQDEADPATDADGDEAERGGDLELGLQLAEEHRRECDAGGEPVGEDGGGGSEGLAPGAAGPLYWVPHSLVWWFGGVQSIN